MSKEATIADRLEADGHALTTNELSDLLSISKVTLYKMVKSGSLPSFRVGICVRFDPHVIAAWIRERTT
jgi:excisionase family DNA binding protein